MSIFYHYHPVNNNNNTPLKKKRHLHIFYVPAPFPGAGVVLSFGAGIVPPLTASAQPLPWSTWRPLLVDWWKRHASSSLCSLLSTCLVSRCSYFLFSLSKMSFSIILFFLDVSFMLRVPDAHTTQTKNSRNAFTILCATHNSLQQQQKIVIPKGYRTKR